MRQPPEDFVRRLKAQQGSDWDVRWNMEVERWEFLSNSAAGVPVSQFWGWFRNPLTGEPIEADPDTGLLPFRDIVDQETQDEILRNLRESDIRKGLRASGTWKQEHQRRRDHNTNLFQKRAKERGWTIANLIKEVDLRRPWVKHHRRSHRKTYVPISSARGGGGPTPFQSSYHVVDKRSVR